MTPAEQAAAARRASVGAGALVGVALAVAGVICFSLRPVLVKVA
jgi:hypothetical protein